MNQLETCRLLALGIPVEQLSGIKAFELEVKKNLIKSIRSTINAVPTSEFAKGPDYIKDKFSRLLEEIIK